MTPEKWEKINRLFHSAAELAPADRQVFLARECCGDDTLIHEIESLLAADAEAGDFIIDPVVPENAATLLAEGEPQPSLHGRLLHYEIVSAIGSGGMGDVYLARDLKLNRSVAIKTLPSSYTTRPDFLKRFRTEAQAAATLNHPNVATIYSVEVDRGRPFITMEYVEGETLSGSIPKDGMTVSEFLEIFIPLSDALAHAHDKGIVHRDIKPGNVMITPFGLPKILDFGLAIIDPKKPFSDDAATSKITQPGQILGTPSYMSPEQAQGQDIDARTDIFSFGVLMYEALTGHRPFIGESHAEIVSNLLKTDPVPVNEHRPDAPFLLTRLILRCLAKSRRERVQTMREVRAILVETRAAIEAGVSMDSSAPRFIRGAEPPRSFLLPAVLALAAVGIVGAILFYISRPPADPPISFANVTLRRLSQTNNVVFAHITPDGKSVLYNTIEPEDQRALWIRRIDDKNALQLMPAQRVQYWGGLTSSHDGSQVFFITAGRDDRHGTLYRLSSLGGTPRKLVETVNDLGAVSPDGQRILFVRYGEVNHLASASVEDGSGEKVLRVGTSPGMIFRDPQFSPDGNSLYYIKRELRDAVEVWSLVKAPVAGGDELTVIPERRNRINEISVLPDESGLVVNMVDPVSNLAQLTYISLPDGRQTRITNDLNSYFGVSVDRDVRTIVSAQRYDTSDLWVGDLADPDGMRKVTIEPNAHQNVKWTPDGRLVYDAVDNNRPHIWIVNEDGTGLQQLTPNDSSDDQPAVSPDGRFIVFTSDRSGENRIWRMNIDGSNPVMLSATTGIAELPHIMPDGKTVLFHWQQESRRVIGRVPMEGGEAVEVPGLLASMWAVSPDGKRFAYTAHDPADGRIKIFVRPIDSPEPVTVFDVWPFRIMTWMPDGSGLLLRERESRGVPHATVWLQPITGGPPREFVTLPSDTAEAIALNPDGRRAAIMRGKLFTDAVMLTKIDPK